jgi:small subunit ribosomal protein S1
MASEDPVPAVAPPVSDAEPTPGEAEVNEVSASDGFEREPSQADQPDDEGEAAGEPSQADQPDDEGEAASEPSQADQPDEAGEAASESEAGSVPPESGVSEAPASDATDASGKKRKRRRKKKRLERPESGSEHPHRPPRPASERAPFHVGEEVFGKVTAVLDTAVMVDLLGKALAIFDRSEMDPDDLVPGEGDRFVARVHNDGARGGLVVLTRKPLREEDEKPVLEEALKDGRIISGLITGAIKGGVEVDIGGVRAFAPASGMDLHPSNANFTALVGQRLDFKVIQFKNAGRDVVVTRRPMLEAEAHERRKQALGLLTEGQVMRGVVRTVVDWGVFVALPDAENLEGLVHVSESSHERNPDLAELFRPGDDIEVKITKIDEKGKIWLSRKALIEDPWAEARKKYAPGTVMTGKVTRLEPFGAFVELEPGVEGLLHTGDLSLTANIEHPKDLLKEGQDLAVLVHRFDQRDKRITLHPAPTGEQAAEEAQRITRGASVKVEVMKVENSGVIVRVLGVTGRAARGFIPAGQTSTARGTDLRKAFKVGSILDVKVVDVDPKRGEPKLSIKGLKDDEERRAAREYRQKLKAESSFGTLGDLLAAKLNLASKGSGD